MNKYIKQLKPLFSIAVACSLTVSSFLGVTYAEGNAENLVDYCLTTDNTIRDGVNITASYQRTDGSKFIYTGEDDSGADGGVATGSVLNKVLTSTSDEYKNKMFGFFGGWKKDADIDSYYIQIDLGSIRNINQIELVPFANYDSGGDFYWRTGRIYLSNDENFENKFEVTNGATLFESFKPNVYTFEKSDTKKYRYLRYWLTTGKVFGAAHIGIKGYCDDLFGRWSHIEVGSGYVVDIPVEHFADEKEYTMMSALYDGNGETIGFNSARVRAAEGVLGNTVFSDKNVASVWSGLFNNSNELIYAVQPYISGESPMKHEKVELPGTQFARFTENHNTISVKAKSENPDNMITCIVLKNCDKTKSAEEYFAEIGENLNGQVQYIAAEKSGDGVALDVELTEKGVYYFKVTESGETESNSVYYRFSLVPDEEKEQFVNKIFNTDGSDWNDIVSYYGDELELINESNLHDAAAVRKENFEKTLIKTREMLYSGEEHTLAEAIELVNSAITLDAMYSGDYEKLGGYVKSHKLLSDCIGEYSDWNCYTKVLSGLINKNADAKETARILRSAAILSFIQDATASKIAEALKKYEKELGIDLNLCKEYNVDIDRVCSRLDNSKAYVYDNGKLKTAFEDAVKAEANRKNQTTGSSTKKGGGGGGTATVPIITKNPDQAQPDTQPSTDNKDNKDNKDNEEQKLLFSDLKGFEWAEKSIYKLSEADIISGSGNDCYEPDRNVTRAEFAKMIVTALDIKVDEKKEMHFIDCLAKDWYYPYVAICYSVYICNGVDEYHFNPDSSITRQDIAVMLSKAMAYKGLSINVKEKKCNEEIAGYAEEAFEKMLESGIINGYDDGTFRPSNSINRAEAAVVLCNVMNYVINGGKQ